MTTRHSASLAASGERERGSSSAESTVRLTPGEAEPGEHPAPWLRHWPRGYPAAIQVPQVTLADNLEIAARRYPERAAIRYCGTVWTYLRLYDTAQRLARHLVAQDVQPGDRVLLMSQNCPQFIAAFHAVVAAGGIVVPVNAMSTADELAHYIEDSGARHAIVAQELLGAVTPALADRRLVHVVVIHYAEGMDADTQAALPEPMRAPLATLLPAGALHWQDALAQASAVALPTLTPDGLCLLPYTSGTTGRPKGCMHSHQSLLASTTGAALWRGMHAESVVLGVAPLFHLLGLQNAMLMPISVGAAVVLMPRWDAGIAAALIERHRVTTWAAPPAMLNDFFAHPEAQVRDLSSLALLNGGGAAMPESLARMLHERYGLNYIEGYGMTETASFLHCNPLQASRRQCLGIPAFGVDSRIVDPATLEELPQGEVGELITSAPQLMLGYWRNDAANAESFFERDGKRFFRTGDLASMDEDGYFYLRDRLKRMINVSGFKVWPAEVESLLHSHPDIFEACVVARADARQGESVRAVISLRPESELSSEDLVLWCRERLSAYKVPRHVEFRPTLPRSGTGKVSWRDIQAEDQADRPAQDPAGSATS